MRLHINSVNERLSLNTEVFEHVVRTTLGMQSELRPQKEDLPEESRITETVLRFADGQPSCFEEDEGGVPFRGQERVKRELEVTIGTLGANERFKALLTGPAGTGKTTLAWIIADRIRTRHQALGITPGKFYELLPSQVNTKAELDQFMKALRSYDIVFVDEIHILKSNVGAEPLYHTLDDTGVPRYPLGNGEGWIDVPVTVSWIGATTEPGELDDTTGGALRRRLSPELRLDAPDLRALIQIIEDQTVEVEHDAAVEIAMRSGGLPWQVINLYNTARKTAQFTGEDIITFECALDTFDMVGVDQYGLFTEDRTIINTLLSSPSKLRTGEVRYKMSETALCAAAGVDRNTYKQIVQPRLMRLGCLTTVGGQCLTEKAVGIFNDHSGKTTDDPAGPEQSTSEEIRGGGRSLVDVARRRARVLFRSSGSS